jgi:putative NIF3 family GTP cyclohydrolase 1 type 2
MITTDTVSLALLALDARATAIEECIDELAAALIRHGLLTTMTAPEQTESARPLPGQAPLPGL